MGSLQARFSSLRRTRLGQQGPQGLDALFERRVVGGVVGGLQELQVAPKLVDATGRGLVLQALNLVPETRDVLEGWFVAAVRPLLCQLVDSLQQLADLPAITLLGDDRLLGLWRAGVARVDDQIAKG